MFCPKLHTSIIVIQAQYSAPLPVDGVAEDPNPEKAGAEVAAVPKPEGCAPPPNVKPDIFIWKSSKWN